MPIYLYDFCARINWQAIRFVNWGFLVPFYGGHFQADNLAKRISRFLMPTYCVNSLSLVLIISARFNSFHDHDLVCSRKVRPLGFVRTQ